VDFIISHLEGPALCFLKFFLYAFNISHDCRYELLPPLNCEVASRLVSKSCRRRHL
jgi:hypothetical protein